MCDEYKLVEIFYFVVGATVVDICVVGTVAPCLQIFLRLLYLFVVFLVESIFGKSLYTLLVE